MLAPLPLEIFPYFFRIANRCPFANPGILRGLDLTGPVIYEVTPLKKGPHRAWGFV